MGGVGDETGDTALALASGVADSDPMEGGVPDDAEEEIEPARVHADPGQPIQAQIDKHRDDQHLPYRSWCKECVDGRGTGEQHRSRPEASKVPTLAFDYMLIT